MKPKFEQKLFSRYELAGGSVALAAVGLIALFGFGVARIPSLAALPHFSVASTPLPRTVAGSSVTQPSEPSNGSNVAPEQQPYRLASGADDQNPRGASGADTSGSALAYVGDGDLSAPAGKALRVVPAVLTQAPTAETAILPPPETERTPLNRSDAMWIQERLHDLGYFSGERDGVWDVASRNALHDFKSMNGLSADDRWDKRTEQRLSSGRGIRADSTFIGRWANDIGQCRGDHGPPIVITSRTAETGIAECNFRSVTRQVASWWRVTAMCSAGRNSWNADMQLKLTTPNLTWDRMLETGKETMHGGKHTDIEYARFTDDLVISTEQGAGRYVRCSQP
jgi:peptidoglycan hydrolase-like protein with peptidoglycan-binding domain